MTILQLLILAGVQGVTEFLPISSSAHLILTSQGLGWPDQGLELDVAVHAGTLLAVLIYFHRDIFRILFMKPRRFGERSPPLAWMIVVATIPVGIAGFVLYEAGTTFLRSPEIIAWATLGFGILLFVSDRLGLTINRLEDMTWGAAIAIGIAQVLALIPGTSRSGVTMTAARFLGFERIHAARFSMLLSIPVIAAATLLTVLETGAAPALTQSMLIAAAFSFFMAIIAIWFMMSWLRRSTFTPFVVYRILLGAGLLVWLYS